MYGLNEKNTDIRFNNSMYLHLHKMHLNTFTTINKYVSF